MLTIIIFVVLAFYFFFDTNYFVRSLWLAACASINKAISKPKPIGLLEESVLKGLCWTSDLDYMRHMNNARYLRECDFGRHKWLMETSVLDVLRSLGGGLTTAASTIRYRRSIEVFDTFTLHTKVVCWDEKAFYIEQRFHRCSDNFLCAIALVKFPMIRVTPQAVADKLLGEGTMSPVMPEDVKHWVQFNLLSSEKLKVL